MCSLGRFRAGAGRYHRVGDVEEDVRQSLRRIEASPFVTLHTSVRGFVFDVATGKLHEVTL